MSARRGLDVDEPAVLESFSSRDDGTPAPLPKKTNGRKPAADTASKVKISPFKRDDLGETEKDKSRKQASCSRTWKARYHL